MTWALACTCKQAYIIIKRKKEKSNNYTNIYIKKKMKCLNYAIIISSRSEYFLSPLFIINIIMISS